MLRPTIVYDGVWVLTQSQGKVPVAGNGSVLQKVSHSLPVQTFFLVIIAFKSRFGGFGVSGVWVCSEPGVPNLL